MRTHPCVANMFPGMEFIPLIGIVVALFVSANFGGMAFVALRRTSLKRRGLILPLSVVIGLAPVTGFIVYSTHYVSPLKLPSDAKQVKISCAIPFSLAIDDNLRFG